MVAGGQLRAGAFGSGSWQDGVAPEALPEGDVLWRALHAVPPGAEAVGARTRSFSTIDEHLVYGPFGRGAVAFRALEGGAEAPAGDAGAVAWCGVPAGVRGSGGGCVGAVDEAVPAELGGGGGQKPTVILEGTRTRLASDGGSAEPGDRHRRARSRKGWRRTRGRCGWLRSLRRCGPPRGAERSRTAGSGMRR